MGWFDTKRKKTGTERIKTALKGDFSSKTNTKLGDTVDFVKENKKAIAITTVAVGGCMLETTVDTGVDQVKKGKKKSS